MDPPPVNGGPVMAEDNVINRKAGSDQSLYQICVNLQRRLAGVPGFEPHLLEMAADDEEDQATDPVTSMWRCFRKGYPLMTIVNASNPEVLLEVNTQSVREAKIGKAATFKFLQSCMSEFQFPPQECFLITDLYTDDTNGFVKVAKVVNRVLDILDQRGLLYKAEGDVVDQPHRSTPTTTRQHIIEELIRTEKDYIGHLEMLQLLKKQLEETGRLTGDSIYSIFLNLNNILDFGRRFLIRIEQHDQLPEDKQNWGQLFTHYQGAFSVYEPFIANNSRCTSTVEAEWDKISMIADHSRDLQQMVASVATLSGFLLKPFQRMTRYPMMLLDLRKRGGLNEEQQAACEVAIEAIQDVLNQANSAVDKEHREGAVVELYQRVDDWKGIKRDSFGELLLFGNFTVLKGDGGKDTEREVRELFDEFDSMSKALLREIFASENIQTLQVAGMTRRAFTYRRRMFARKRWPMTPREFGLTGALKSASRSVPRGIGKLFTPKHKKDSAPQFALDGGRSPEGTITKPLKHKSSTASFFKISNASKVTVRKMSDESPVSPSPAFEQGFKKKHSVSNFMRRQPSAPSDGTPFGMSDLETSQSARQRPVIAHDPERHDYCEGPTTDKHFPLMALSTFSHAMNTSPPYTPPPPPTRAPPPIPKTPHTSQGPPTPAVSSHSRESDVVDYFGDTLVGTPSRSNARGSGSTDSRTYVDGEVTPRAGSPLSLRRQLTESDRGSRACTTIGSDDSPAQVQSLSRMSRFAESLRSLSRTNTASSNENVPCARSRTQSQLSQSSTSQSDSRPESRDDAIFMRPRSGDLVAALKKKLNGAIRLSDINTACVAAVKSFKSPLAAVSPIAEKMIYDSKRGKKIKINLTPLIHDFLMNGPFSQHNTFLHSIPVVNVRSPTKTHWKELEPFEQDVANIEDVRRPYVVQYSIYLFERILLCCKDVNPTKQRSNVMSRNRNQPLANVKGKPRLQLKGRIFMANVTDIISSQKPGKPGSYTIQIFWKGDPGVENFIIRFSSEDVMRKWYKAIDDQRAMRSGERARQQGTSNTQFNYLMNGPQMENPYQTEEDAEFEEEPVASQSEFSMSRNASSNSLRARSATGGSGGSGGTVRPPRFPMPEPGLPPLSLQTQFSNAAPSPSERIGNSYFSPVEQTPLSTRSSSQSGSYFPRQATPVNAREAENNRYTAPALSRVTSRESQSSYYSNGRTSRPSMQPAMSTMSAQQIGMAQSRARSASSPDIHNPNGPGRRYPVMPPDVPVPPIPSHMAGMRAPINRSQNNSPTNGMPIRTATQSQQYGYRNPNSAQYGYEQQARTDGRSPMAPVTNGNGVNPIDRVVSPPIAEPINEEDYMPGQLKAKVSFEDNYVTLVIASNIHFRSLTDRVEAKLARFTNRPIGKNSVRLRYKDEDGDFVTIDSDEAVQEAFLEWREQHRNLLAAGQMGQVGEIQLFCQVVDAL